ncbi:extracellular solute-binding protein, partial [bacterium]
GGLKVAGFLPGSPGWWPWAWADFFGGDVFKDGKLAVDSPENVRAFEWIARYAKEFGSKEVQSFQSGFGGFSSPQDPFLSGKTATEFNGTWKANYVNVYKPGLKWFAVPFPYPEGRPDLANRTILNQDVFMIPRGAKHTKEAFEFIRYVQRQDVMERLCSAQGKNSPLARVSPAFFAHHPNHEIRLFDRLARSPGAFSQPQVGIFPQINTELSVAFEEVNTGAKTPKQALHDAQNRLQTVWDTYRTQVLAR